MGRPAQARFFCSQAYGQLEISERHRHRYEFNREYEEILVAHGLDLVGVTPDGTYVEIVEIRDHPWFLGCQFHPEFKSRPLEPHPLFKAFIGAAYQYRRKRLGAFPSALLADEAKVAAQRNGEGNWKLEMETGNWKLSAGNGSRAVVQVPSESDHDYRAIFRVSIARATMSHVVPVGRLKLGAGQPLFVIAGPCVIESERHTLRMAERLATVARALRVPYIFKASFDKANRTSLRFLSRPRPRTRPSDSGARQKGIRRSRPDRRARASAGWAGGGSLRRHPDSRLSSAARPICCSRPAVRAPWSISRRANSSRPGIFATPLKKSKSQGNHRILVTERGSTFGYNNLVVDIRGLAVMKGFGFPVILDVTHALQFPAVKGTRAGGNRSSSALWRGRAWRREWMAFSWKSTTAPNKPSLTAPTRCRFASSNLWSGTSATWGSGYERRN